MITPITVYKKLTALLNTIDNLIAYKNYSYCKNVFFPALKINRSVDNDNNIDTPNNKSI